jgi:penicillin-binding protein 2
MSTAFPPRRGPGRGSSRPAGGWAPALTPRTAVRIAILGGIAMGLLGVLLIRLWFLQVINAEQYAERADGNRLRTVITQPPRGNILTRDGVPLVTNTTGENLVARPRELTGERRRQVLAKLAPKIGQTLPALMKKVEAGDNQPLQSVVLARNIDPGLYRYLAERRRDFPGISLEETFLRSYPQGQLAAHVLGSTGPITAEQIKDLRRRGYAGDETIGVDGVEQQYESVLRGTPGRSVVEVDAAGEPQGREYISSRSPVPGRDVRLSIDSKTQLALEQALAEAARVTGAVGAAGVALDPKTGEVLALGSYPTFSPQTFVTRKEKAVSGLFNDPDRPLNDRAIAGVYPAGSTFKAITAAAALRSGIITPTTPLESPSSIVLYKQRFQNFEENSHGVIDLPYALRVSSDTYFYQVADELYKAQSEKNDVYPLQDEARRFGLGDETGIDLPGEVPANVPDPPWKKRAYAGPDYTDFQRSWLAGDTIQLGVGQGFLQVTPLQMAVAYGAIANGGTLYTPTVGMEVRDPNGRVVQELSKGRPTRPLGVSPADLEAIKQGLYDAANAELGTSTSVFGALPDEVKVAGKTGTAEPGDGGEDHSWFVGYAPFDDPSIVVSIVIERGGTGANAAAPAVCSTMAANLDFDPALCGDPVASR